MKSIAAQSQPTMKLYEYPQISLTVAFLLLAASAANQQTNQVILLSQENIPIPNRETQKISAGLTGDPCATQTDCLSPRSCAKNTTTLCNAPPCLCLPPTLRYCTSNEECPPGEVCTLAAGGFPFCVSAAIVAADPKLDEFFRANGTGLTSDTCGVTNACLPPRKCLTGDVICIGDKACFCMPPNLQPCSSSTQCPAGERCVINTAIKTQRPVCWSLEASSTLSTVEWNSSQGLTYDFCRSTDECADGRTCRKLSELDTQCEEGVWCVCYPSANILCARSTDCVDGEICASESRDDGSCFSAQAAPYFNMREVQPRLSLLLDACTSSQDCKPPRECGQASLEGPCEPGKQCVCLPPGFLGCDGNSDCKEGEICVQRKGEPSLRAICLKESAALEQGFQPVGNKTGTGVLSQSAPTLPVIKRRCIAKQLLRGLEKDDLLYEQDVLAHVLCDSAGNCATSGHIVVFKGKAMMMKSHCLVVGCVKRVMEVNSPRYKKRLRIKGLTRDLQFSALAARYGTRAEEMLITFMMRVGL